MWQRFEEGSWLWLGKNAQNQKRWNELGDAYIQGWMMETKEEE